MELNSFNLAAFNQEVRQQLPGIASDVEGKDECAASLGARLGSEPTRDCADAGNLPSDGAQSNAVEIHRGSGTPPGRESRTLPATDPGAFQHLQGESRESP